MRELSPFDIFGLPERFALDAARLKAAHQQAILKVHPDRFADRSPAERRVAEQWSARINEAFALLSDPVRRAGWLCEKAGHPLKAETDTRMPADFLMAQIEYREALENAAKPEDVDAVLEDARSRADREAAALQVLIDEKADWEGAVAAARRLLFIDRLIEEAKKRRAQLER